MQNLFAVLTLALLLTATFFAQKTGMPTENLYALLIAMTIYVAYALIKGSNKETASE